MLFFSPIVRVGGFTISFMISPAACIEAFVPKEEGGRRRKKEREGERRRKKEEGGRRIKEEEYEEKRWC